MADDVTALRIKVLSDDVELSKRRLDDLTNTSKKTDKAVGDMGSRMASSMRNFAAGAVTVGALSAVVLTNVKNWQAYDKSMKEVSSIMGSSRQEFQDLRDDVLKLSTSMGIDATVAAKGLYQAISAGIPKENALSFLAVASKAAIAGVTDVETSVNVLTNVINAYKLPVSDAASISDKLFSAVVAGKVTMEELSKDMAKVTPAAAAIGVSLDEVLASVVALTLQGTPSSQAFTQIAATMTAMKDASPELNSALNALGYSSARAAFKAEDYGTILQKLRVYAGDNDQAFFKLFGRIEASDGVISQSGENFKLYTNALKGSLESAGAAEKAAAINADTLGNSLNGLKSSFIGLIETMENRFSILKNTAELLKATGAALAGQNAQANELSSRGEVSGAIAIQERLNQLLEKRSALQAKISKRAEIETDGFISATSIIEALPGTDSDAQRLGRTEAGIKTLEDAMSKFSEETRKAAGQFLELETIAKGAGSQEDKQAAIDAKQQSWKDETDQIAKRKSLLLEEQDRQKQADEKKRNSMIKLQAEKEAKVKEDAKLLEDAQKAATSEVEALDLQIDKLNELQNLTPKQASDVKEQIELLLEKKNILLDSASLEKSLLDGSVLPPKQSKAGQIEETKEQIELTKRLREEIEKQGTSEIELRETKKLQYSDFAKAHPEHQKAAEDAIAAIDAEISKIREVQAEKEKAASDEIKRDAEKRESLLSRLADSLLPSVNSENRYEIEEAEIVRSHNQRKKDILEITGLTEAEKSSLILESERKLNDDIRNITRLRATDNLNAVRDSLDNIASVQGEFGEKGFKIAQAAAIASATVSMFESAVSSYAAGAKVGGPIVGGIFAATAVAAQVANIANIKSQTYSGAYEHGGMIPSGSFGLVGEAGPEFVSGPAFVTSAKNTSKALSENSSGQKPTVNVILQNLPGQTAEVSTSDDGKTITLAVKQTLAQLTKEANQGGGTVFPAFANSHGLKRR